MNKIPYILKESGSRNIGYAKFLVSLQKLIGRVAPDAWGDKSQIDPTSIKRIHNSLRKKYGGDYEKYNALLKTQKGQFGNWHLQEGSVNVVHEGKMPFSKNDWDVKWNVAKGTRKDSEVAVNARWKAIRGLMGGEHKSIRRFVKETTIWKSLTYDEFVKWYTQLLKELS